MEQAMDRSGFNRWTSLVSRDRGGIPLKERFVGAEKNRDGKIDREEFHQVGVETFHFRDKGLTRAPPAAEADGGSAWSRDPEKTAPHEGPFDPSCGSAALSRVKRAAAHRPR